MSDVAIPAEAVEAAAAAFVDHYDYLPEDIKQHWRHRARRVLPAAAPLILAANQPTEVPDDVALRAWEEFIYPRNSVKTPMPACFASAVGVINEWLVGRAAVLRGDQESEETGNGLEGHANHDERGPSGGADERPGEGP